MSSVVASFVTFDTEIITIVLLTMASAGFGGHQANVIQYGLDQLQDASTDEITAFISWYAWTAFSAGVVIHYTYTCIYKEYLILSRVAVCFFLTVGLIMTFYTKHTLIIEPVTQNPFKLVHNVLKYAIKTSIQDVGVPSPTVKMSFLLVLTLVRVNMEDHSQQSRLKMSKLSSDYSFSFSSAVHCQL